MSANDTADEKSGAQSDSQHTCEVCGETSYTVSRNSFADLDLPPVWAHSSCLPSVHADPFVWYREEVQQ